MGVYGNMWEEICGIMVYGTKCENCKGANPWQYIYGRHLDGQVYMGVGGSLTGRLLPIDLEAVQSGRVGRGAAAATGAGSDGKRQAGNRGGNFPSSKTCPSYSTEVSQASGQLSHSIPLSPDLLMGASAHNARPPYVTLSERSSWVRRRRRIKALEAAGYHSGRGKLLAAVHCCSHSWKNWFWVQECKFKVLLQALNVFLQHACLKVLARLLE